MHLGLTDGCWHRGLTIGLWVRYLPVGLIRIEPIWLVSLIKIWLGLVGVEQGGLILIRLVRVEHRSTKVLVENWLSGLLIGEHITNWHSKVRFLVHLHRSP